MDEPCLVLLVEDETPMRLFVRASLTSHGFRLIEATTGREAVSLLVRHRPGLVLLDLGLPDGDGIALTRRFRESSQVPIIVLSARGREEDKVSALDAGADDYLTKPFGVRELLARMRVALRHVARSRDDVQEIEIGSLHLELGQRRVTVAGRAVHLTPIQYRLLICLARHAGKVLTHGQLLREVWGPSHASSTHYLRVYMAQLRQKIEADPARPVLLLTEPGVGYRLRER
jgi:two-component system KDP operon response regulator KdpE